MTMEDDRARLRVRTTRAAVGGSGESAAAKATADAPPPAAPAAARRARSSSCSAAPPPPPAPPGWHAGRTAVFLAYLTSLAWYMHARVTTSLDLGPYTW